MTVKEIAKKFNRKVIYLREVDLGLLGRLVLNDEWHRDWGNPLDDDDIYNLDSEAVRYHLDEEPDTITIWVNWGED